MVAVKNQKFPYNNWQRNFMQGSEESTECKPGIANHSWGASSQIRQKVNRSKVDRRKNYSVVMSQSFPVLFGAGGSDRSRVLLSFSCPFLNNPQANSSEKR